MGFYESIRDKVALPLLTKYGLTVTLKKPGVTAGYTKSFDSVQGRYKWTGTTGNVTYTDPGTDASYTCKAIWKTANEMARDEGTAKENDRTMLILSQSAVPEPLVDKVTAGSVTYQIKTVRKIEPGGVAVIYELGVSV